MHKNESPFNLMLERLLKLGLLHREKQATVVAKTEFIHTPTIEINLNSQIHLVSTSELIENDSLNRKITQAINKSVKITEYQTMNCLSFCVKTYIM